MVNLLTFKADGGRQRYLQYAEAVVPHLQRVGATVHYAGTAPPGGTGNFAVAGHRRTYGDPFKDF
ncbi:MAG: hypothetical protein REJ50_17635, partial [Bordetella sp.]|nr:hypothetical protein [Bordetella sp.]